MGNKGIFAKLLLGTTINGGGMSKRSNVVSGILSGVHIIIYII